MYTTLLVFIFVACVVLILTVLAQNPKGGGLSSAFGGSGATQFMGVKKTTDLLEKITFIVIAIIMVLAVIANIVVVPDTTTAPTTLSPNVRKAQETLTLPKEEDNTFLLPADSSEEVVPATEQ